MFVNKILYEFLQLHGECYFKFFLCFLICFCVSSRQTGALNRIIDRGSRAINYILTVMVFNVVPTILEVIINSLSVTVKLHLLYTFLSLSLSVTYSLAFSVTSHCFLFFFTDWHGIKYSGLQFWVFICLDYISFSCYLYCFHFSCNTGANCYNFDLPRSSC
jgi:hypothetical protein